MLNSLFFIVQGQCKPNAIEFIRIAEAPPELAVDIFLSTAKVRRFLRSYNPTSAAFCIPYVWHSRSFLFIFGIKSTPESALSYVDYLMA